MTRLTLALALLSAPLSAQVAGTWTATTTRMVHPITEYGQSADSVEVTESGTLTFAPDATYTAQRRWAWLTDGERAGMFSYIEGTWRVTGDSLCVKREDMATETCQPFTATAHALQWGAFTFTGAADASE